MALLRRSRSSPCGVPRSSNTRRAQFAVAAFVICLSGITPLRAAGTSGTVTFNTLPVPGATVIASRDDVRHRTTTGADGTYRFADLADGPWSIDVAMLGFAPIQREIQIGQSEAPETFVLELRPFEDLARDLTLATSASPSATTPAAGTAAPRGATTPVRTGSTRATPALAPPPPSGEENAAPTNNFNAADGFLINGSVNNAAASPFAQLAAFGNNRRGGRSLYNGGLGIVLGNSAFDARPFTFTGAQTRKPSYNDLQILGTFGGPIRLPGVRNAPTFFLGVQSTLQNNANTLSALMPTDRERGGDFSASTDALGRPVQIVDPASGRPFDGNVIPRDRISPQAASLLSLYPSPTLTAPGYNYQTPALTTTRQNNVQVRGTQTLSTRSSLAGNVLYSRSLIRTDGLFGFLDSTRTFATDAALNWSRRMSPLSSLRMRYQFLRQGADALPYFSDRRNISGEAGITGNNQDAANWGPPNLTFSSGIAGLSSPQRTHTVNDSHVASAELLRGFGRHNVTFGGGMGQQRLNVDGQQDARGSFGFTGSVTGDDLADFLLGAPSTSAIAFGNADKRLRGAVANAYVNDDWRLSPTLTLNVGLRWEYESPMTETGGRLANLDVARNFATAAAVTPEETGAASGLAYSGALVNPDWSGVQPRIGVAWRPIAGSSLVVRGGYGLYRNSGTYQALALLMAQQPPFSKTLSVANSTATPLTLANGFPLATGIATNTLGIDPDVRVGIAENWQLSAQRDLPGSMTITGTYFGTRGHRLLQQFLPNTYPAGAPSPCPSCPVGFTYVTSNAASLRNAGQVQLRRRLRNGLTATLQYTLAKATDNASAFVPVASAQGASSTAGLSGATIAQDWLNLDAEQGRSNFDQRHLLTAEFQYTTGMGVAGGALMDGTLGRLFKGWTIASQLTLGSGLPVTPLSLAKIERHGRDRQRPRQPDGCVERSGGRRFLCESGRLRGSGQRDVGQRGTQLDYRSGPVRAQHRSGPFVPRR